MKKVSTVLVAMAVVCLLVGAAWSAEAVNASATDVQMLAGNGPGDCSGDGDAPQDGSGYGSGNGTGDCTAI